MYWNKSLKLQGVINPHYGEYCRINALKTERVSEANEFRNLFFITKTLKYVIIYQSMSLRQNE